MKKNVVQNIALIFLFVGAFIYLYLIDADKISFSLLIISGFFLYCTRVLSSRIRNNEKTFEEQKIWTNAVIDGAAFAIIATKPSGIIITYNKAAEKILGHKAEDVINKKTPDIFHDREEIISYAKRLSQEYGKEIAPSFETFIYRAKNGSIDSNEWTYIHQSGRRFPVRLIVSAIFDKDGENLGYLGIAEDLTDVKKMEEIIEEQKSSIFETSRLKEIGEMASGVAHEINNPLSIVIGLIDSIFRHPETHCFNEETGIKLKKVKEQSGRIEQIVKSLKLVSRDTARDQLATIKIDQIIQDSLGLCVEKLKFYSIHLELNLAPNLSVSCKPSDLSRVFINLIHNSIDSVAEQENPWIKIETYLKDEDVFILVTDSGAGIPKDIAGRMMNPFFTTKEVGLGTGLGLSISKKIIENHHGKLIYNSQSVHTQFMIRLPYKKEG